MAKRTAIIDIGSNSARMAIYEKTSRFAFVLIKEIKSRVRVGEGAYERNGELQRIPMQRTFQALKEFKDIAKNLKCRKLLCVATSALRDAPNRNTLIIKVKKELGINVKVIDGEKEAYLGGVAALNLLPKHQSATTIDIGGGSSELAKIENGKIVATISLNIGTVRLKEMFFDKKVPIEDILTFLHESISSIPKEFQSDTIFGIGGTIRAISSSIIERRNYPLQTVHAFSYNFEDEIKYIESLLKSSVLKLKDYNFKQDRFDTIREGCAILYTLAKTLHAKELITSGVGVREGVFLCDLLRGHHDKFPENFNPSVRSLSDRFVRDIKQNNHLAKEALKIFEALKPVHNIHTYEKELEVAAKLQSVGEALSFYQYHHHGYHFILNNLNYAFSHKEKILIAMLVKYNSKNLPKMADLKSFESLLPDIKVVNWLSFILSLSKSLNANLNMEEADFSYQNNTLYIDGKKDTLLAREAVKKLIKPASFAIIFK